MLVTHKTNISGQIKHQCKTIKTEIGLNCQRFWKPEIKHDSDRFTLDY